MTLTDYLEFSDNMPCGILIWHIDGDDPTLYYANDAASSDARQGIRECIGQPMSQCLPAWGDTAIRQAIKRQVPIRVDFSYGDANTYAMVNATVKPIESNFVAVILRNKPLEDKIDCILENVQRVIVLLSDRNEGEQ